MPHFTYKVSTAKALLAEGSVTNDTTKDQLKAELEEMYPKATKVEVSEDNPNE